MHEGADKIVCGSDSFLCDGGVYRCCVWWCAVLVMWWCVGDYGVCTVNSH